MPLDTNLNVSPYFDDFNEEKNFHKVLFRPGVAVQARELTQLQTILQNQVERFGDNIFKTGTILKGCSLSTDYNYNYVKIRDQQNDGAPVSLGLYSNTLLVQESSNLQSIVVDSAPGFQSTNPNLNTLYIKYQNTGTGGEKTYANNQTLKVFSRARTLEDVIINDGGTLYTNSDVVVFSGGEGSGATATLTTDATGEIIDISIVSKGSNYITTPNVSITTSTGSGANLVAKNYITELTVANSSFTDPVGVGAAIINAEGVIFQKGSFIRVDRQSVIVSKYTNSPNNVVVGFRTEESLVNSNVDSSLLDLATGTPNFSAPGADRLKLTPILTALTKVQADANTSFLSLLEFQDGRVVKDRTRTQYNYIGKEMNKRTFEESGNYVLNTLPLNTVDRPSNTTYFDLVAGPGTAYVNGERIELLNSVRIPVKKGTDTANSINQTINTLYGSYILIKETLGIFEIKTGSTVNLRSVAATDVSDNPTGTPTAPGSIIGTAKVRSLEYDSGVPGTPDCRYRLYVFDIKLSPGQLFKDVRSVSIGSTAVADIVLNTSNNADIKDIDNDILLFSTGTNAVKELTQEEFIFRTSTNATFTTSGDVTITFSGGNTLPYGTGTLTDTIKQEFILIPTNSFRGSANQTGVVSANTDIANVSGVGTSFTSSFEVGDYIVIGNTSVNSIPQRITAIFSDTLLRVANTFTGLSGTSNAVSNGIFKAYPSNIPVDLTKNGRTVTVNSNTSITIDLGEGTNTTGSFVLYHDLENFEPAVRAKILNNPVYVKLSTNTLKNNLTGPWCIGVPDVLSIEAVYVGSSNTYSESGTNYASSFELDSGQKDNYYGLAYLKRKPGAALRLDNNNCLLIKVKSFTHGTGKYISTESYPVDDTTSPLPSNKIRTENIPFYTSSTTGEAFSLRDSIDFRPIVSNTAVLSTTAGGASVDPPAIETLTAGEKFFPAPSKQFECNIESYLPRIDRIVMGTDGVVRTIAGVPSNTPTTPPSEQGVMDLGILNIAPFPSLTAKTASDISRPDLKNRITLLQTKRYTMKDIKDIETRIQRLEYYSLLNTLEANTKSLTITSANNQLEVFKNGFFVDAFDNYKASNLNDGEYKAQIEVDQSLLTPQQELTPIDVKLNIASSNNVVKKGDLVLLNYNEAELVKQPVANKIRTLTELFWRFAGTMRVVPRVDNFFDTEVTATSVIDVNIADPLNDLIDAQNEINRTLTQNTRLLSRVNVGGATLVSSARVGDFIIDNLSQSIRDTFLDTSLGIRVNAPVVTSQQEIGNFLTSATVTPYVREQKIGVYVTGLRPGAQHYVFFDGVDLTGNSVPAQITNFTDVSLTSFIPTVNKNSSPGLFANSSGELAAIVSIPGNTFTAGDKNILVMDIPLLSSEMSATSKSVGQFSAFGIKGQSTEVTLSTKNFDLKNSDVFSSQTFSTTRVVNSSVSWTRSTWDPIIQNWGGDGGGDGGGGGDPLAQSFIVPKQAEGDIQYLTSVDFFFRDKDDEKGVTIELRETDESGYPTARTLPFSRVHKKSTDINTSNNGTVATTFSFETPVAVKVNKEYVILLTPDGNSPNYRAWTAVAGSADVANNTLVSNQTWGLGTMFYSTSNRAYSAVQDEDIKFTVRRAEFTNQTGNIILNNDDYEFLSVNAISGSFRGGESVAQMSNSYLSTILTTNTTSFTINTSSSLSPTLASGDYVLIIYGTGQTIKTGNVQATGITLSNAASNTTAFTTDYSNGSFIRVGNELRQIVNVNSDSSITLDAPFSTNPTGNVHYLITPEFDVLRITSANSTSISVNRPPVYTVNTSVAASIQKVVHGIVTYYSDSKGKLYLNGSNSSNSNFLIRVSNSSYYGYLIGDTSNTVATVTSINNIDFANFLPLINTIIPPTTGISMNATLSKSSGGTSTQNYSLTEKNSVNINDTSIIKSRSNEISGVTLTKSFTANIALYSGSTDTSPGVDINPSSIVTTKYLINNSSADENTRYGNAQAKYVSKILALNEGLDSEDVRVYVRGYRPVGTDIEVYAKILNSADNESFNDKDWSQLELISPSSLYSSSLNTTDIKEYIYTFKKSPSSQLLPGVITTYSNSTIDGFNTQFTTTFNANSDVDETTDFISITSNKYRDGDVVTYVVDSGNTSLSALVSNNQYYVVQSNTTGIKLALSSAGTPLQLTKGFTEAGHHLDAIVAGDVVKIIQASTTDSYDIIPVTSVTDANTLVLASNVSFTGTGFTLEKVLKPHEAFKYNRNDFIVRYFDLNNAAHDTYKFLAIKVVLKSQYDYIVPLVDDIRAIATSV